MVRVREALDENHQFDAEGDADFVAWAAQACRELLLFQRQRQDLATAVAVEREESNRAARRRELARALTEELRNIIRDLA